MNRLSQTGRRDDGSSRQPEPDECSQEAWQSAQDNASLTWDQLQPARGGTRERIARLVHAIEAEVIPRLVRAHRRDATDHAAAPAPADSEEIQAFARLTIAHDDAATFARIDALCRQGMAPEDIYLQLLAPTARHLGFMWEEDLCDFTDVTVGVGRLQQIMRALSPAFGAEVAPPVNGRRILLAPAPGEQHTFGVSMVTEFFLRAGWDVVSTTGLHAENLIEYLRTEWFDVLGFSLGSSQHVDELQAGIADARRESRNTSLVVMVGGPLIGLHPEYVARVGANGTAPDAQSAPGEAEKLLTAAVVMP